MFDTKEGENKSRAYFASAVSPTLHLSGIHDLFGIQF